MKDGIASKLERERPRIAAFRRALLRWYMEHGRRFPWRSTRASRYERVVSEVLLQRTRAETAARFYRTFIKRFRGWEALGSATEGELRTLLAPIGLWQRRAATLMALGREMHARRGRFPGTRAEIEKLPGIGQYIASAVMLFCHAGREALLDVNMARVLERCFGARQLADIRYDPWLQAVSKAVVSDPKAIEINWAVLDLAAKICLPNKPRCRECPLRTCCRYSLSRQGSRNVSRRVEIREVA